MSKAKNMTKEEFAAWFEGYIRRKFKGNKSDAARHFDELPGIIYEVLSCRRSPTKKILEAVQSFVGAS